MASKEGLRTFSAKRIDGTLVKLTVRHPTRKEIDASDLEMSATFNRSLMAGLPTRARMVKELKRNGLWSPVQEAELTSLREQMGQLDESIKKAKTDSPEHQKLVEERGTVFEQLNGIRSDIESMLGHTADARADESQRNFLIACVTEYDPDPANGAVAGKRVWNDLEGFLGEKDGGLVQRVAYEYIVSSNGLPSEWDSLMAASLAQVTKADEKNEPAAPPAPAATGTSAPVVAVAVAEEPSVASATVEV